MQFLIVLESGVAPHPSAAEGTVSMCVDLPVKSVQVALANACRAYVSLHLPPKCDAVASQSTELINLV